MMRRYAVIGLMAAAFGPLALGAEAGKFTLGKAVPSDVYIYVNGAHNPKNTYVEECWGEVWEEFQKSGVVEEVHTLISSTIPEPDRAGFEKFWSKAAELISGVDWEARADEVAFMGRMRAPMPEYAVLIKYEDGKAAKNADAFSAVLREIATAIGEAKGATYSTTEDRGAKVSTLSFQGAPFHVKVAQRDSIVGIAMCNTLMDEALALLAGEGDKAGLVETDRYRQAIAKLPAGEDSVMFMDFKALFDGVGQLLDMAAAHNADNAEGQQVVDVIKKAFDEFKVIDTIASTGRTEKYTQISETLVTLAPNAEKSRFYKVIKPEPFPKFDRFIPKEATGYSVTSGFDLAALYAAVLDFIGKEVPDGEQLLAKWEAVQDDIGFHPQKDVFDWLGGQFMNVSLPATTPSPFSSADSVVFIKVRDEKLARQKIKTGMDKLGAFLATHKQPLTSQPAEIAGTEDFRMVTHPLVAMFIRPVYGVADGYLIVGTSSQAIEACLATSRGERPSVAQNDRVQREGVIPKGAVASASFSDLTTLGRDIAQVLSMLGMFSAMIPDEPEARPVKAMIGIAGKLAPVAMKIDFLQSTSSATTFDGKAWHTKSVINYRPPKADATAATGS